MKSAGVGWVFDCEGIEIEEVQEQRNSYCNLAIVGIIASTLVVQFGWNKIMITIIDVNRFHFGKRLDYDVLLTYEPYQKKTKKKITKKVFEYCITYLEYYYLCRSAITC